MKIPVNLKTIPKENRHIITHHINNNLTPIILANEGVIGVARKCEYDWNTDVMTVIANFVYLKDEDVKIIEEINDKEAVIDFRVWEEFNELKIKCKKVEVRNISLVKKIIDVPNIKEEKPKAFIKTEFTPDDIEKKVQMVKDTFEQIKKYEFRPKYVVSGLVFDELLHNKLILHTDFREKVEEIKRELFFQSVKSGIYLVDENDKNIGVALININEPFFQPSFSYSKEKETKFFIPKKNGKKWSILVADKNYKVDEVTQIKQVETKLKDLSNDIKGKNKSAPKTDITLEKIKSTLESLSKKQPQTHSKSLSAEAQIHKPISIQDVNPGLTACSQEVSFKEFDYASIENREIPIFMKLPREYHNQANIIKMQIQNCLTKNKIPIFFNGLNIGHVNKIINSGSLQKVHLNKNDLAEEYRHYFNNINFFDRIMRFVAVLNSVKTGQKDKEMQMFYFTNCFECVLDLKGAIV